MYYIYKKNKMNIHVPFTELKNYNFFSFFGAED